MLSWHESSTFTVMMLNLAFVHLLSEAERSPGHVWFLRILVCFLKMLKESYKNCGHVYIKWFLVTVLLMYDKKLCTK